MGYDKEYARRWRALNKDKVAEYNRRRRECRRQYKRRWREQNPDASRSYLQRWFETNPGKRNEYRAAYEARKKRATVKLTPEQRRLISAFYAAARMMTQNTGVRHHVDHIIPLSKGGKHHPSNLQVLTAEQNQRKSAKVNHRRST